MVLANLFKAGQRVIARASGDGELSVEAVAAWVRDARICIELAGDARGASLEPVTRAGAPLTLEIGAADRCWIVQGRVRAFSPPDTVVVDVAGEPRTFQRRQFVRVEDTLPVSYRVVEDEEVPSVRRQIARCVHRPLVVPDGLALAGRNAAPPADTPATAVRAKTRGGAGAELTVLSGGGGGGPTSEIGDLRFHYLCDRMASLEEKLDQLISFTRKDTPDADGGRRLRRISVSGSGVKFVGRHEVPRGASILVRFELPLKPAIEIAALAEVVSSARWPAPRDPDAIGIAAVFRDLREPDRDDIVRYTFQRQREVQKQARESREGGE